MSKPQRRRTTERSKSLIIGVALLTAASAVTACKKQKKYTWRDRLPTAGCDPRTAEAKAKIGACPKLADPKHPTPEEIREFVDYMNKKQEVEGTVATDGLEGPGCVQWRIDPGSGQPTSYHTEKKQGYISYEEQLRNFKLP